MKPDPGGFMTGPASPAEFTPALGHRSLTGLYDAAIGLMTRERVWRSALIAELAPRDGETIVDVGCGTGTLATLIKAAAPGADVIGIDPDPEVLDRALAKAGVRGAEVDFLRGFAGDISDLIGQARADKIVSSLVFHQVPIAGKRAGLAAIHAALRPGGELHIADYGWQRTLPMRLFFRQVQALDGVENTRLNAAGGLPDLIAEAGFEGVEERAVIATATGSISLYRAAKPRGPASQTSQEIAMPRLISPQPPSTARQSDGRRIRLAAVALAIIVAGVDQLAKAWALTLTTPVQVAPFLNLEFGFNRGVTFGLLSSDSDAGRWLLVALTAAVAAAVLTAAWRARHRPVALALGAIAGGALGNIVDRIRQGAVTDFIDFHLGDWRWPTFNLADAAIVCGVAALLWISAIRGRSAT
jgi:lipoprotein signal peptidase